MYSATAISRSSMLFHGPLLRTSSALNSELNASARALSSESPVLPTEATATASARRWVYRTATYCDPKLRVVNQPAEVSTGAPAGPDAHLQGIEGQVGAQRLRQLPADHTAGVDVDDEGGVDPAGEGAAVGDVGNPQLVRASCGERSVDQVGAGVRAGPGHGGPGAFRPRNAA